MIRFACPICQKILKAPPEKSGVTITCPRCQAPLQIPYTPAALVVPMVVQAPPPAPPPPPFESLDDSLPPIINTPRSKKPSSSLGLILSVVGVAVIGIFVLVIAVKFRQLDQQGSTKKRAPVASTETDRAPSPDRGKDGVAGKPRNDEVSALIERLKAKDKGVRISAADKLGDMGARATAALPALESGDSDLEVYYAAKRATSLIVLDVLQSQKKVRKLVSSINTVGVEDMLYFQHIRTVNAGLSDLGVFAGDDSVFIMFDVRYDSWQRYVNTVPFSLLVRLHDANGHYLTHFTTEERFAPPVIGFANSTPLREKRNAFLYSVNKRDLRDTSIAEVGFIHNRR